MKIIAYLRFGGLCLILRWINSCLCWEYAYCIRFSTNVGVLLLEIILRLECTYIVHWLDKLN